MHIEEYQIRLIVFFSVITLITIFEFFFTRRNNKIRGRKINNILLHLTNILISRLIFASAATGVATYAFQNKIGLFHHFEINQTFIFFISIITLDFLIYFQHYLAHRVKILWRLHSLHHSDPDFDWTTAVRFHPLEIVFSLFYKSIFILLFGIPPEAVIFFEALLNSMAIFNHGNFKIPLGLDAFLRYFIVTPDMHRVHHSIVDREKHSNFGFNISLWDRIFKTYVRDPKEGYISMIIGLKASSKNDPQNVKSYLIWPFKSKKP